MYSEQLAVLLLMVANNMSGQAALSRNHEARIPRGGAEQVGVLLKLDPRFNSYRNPYTRKIVQRKSVEQNVLFASND